MNLTPRRRRWLWIIGVLFVLFSVAGFFIAPPIIKAQVLKRASAELGREVTLGKVRANPYTMSVTLEDFDLREKDGKASFLGWKRLYVNLDVLSSMFGTITVSEIELDGFHAALTVNPDKTYNFSDLLARFEQMAAAAPAGKKSAPPAVRIVNLKVDQARFDLLDQSRHHPFKSVVGPDSFTLREFSTSSSVSGTYHLQGVTESGETFNWTGAVTIAPLASHGEWDIGGTVLKKHMPYIEDFVQADVVDGTLATKGHYEAEFSAGKIELKVAGVDVHLRNLKVAERATHDVVVALPAVDLTGVDADAVALKATVNQVAVTGGKVTARREKDGSINLLTMLQPPTGSAATTSVSGTPAKLPEVNVGEIAVSKLAVDVTDNAAPRPATLGLKDLTVSLKNFSLTQPAAMPLDVAFGWMPKGTVHLAGTATLHPDVSVDVKADVAGVEILPLSPYLEQFANVRITQGAVTTSSAVQATLHDGALAANVAGDVSLVKFGLVNGVHSEELAGVGEVKLSGLKVATAPKLTVSLAEVGIVGPYARVVVDADKSINLLAALQPVGAPAAPAKASTTPAELPKVDVARVVISDGDFSFTDRSLEPNVRMAISQFGGTISGMSSENLTRGDVELKGVVDGAGPVAIAGKLDPLSANKYVDLKVDFKNVDLLPTSPYSGKFAGYELARGKLVVDSTIRLEGQKLDSKNVVTLNQFTFGSATNSPDATALPVRLGVALLKDIDGKIVIDLPVQGSLDDPNFRVGKVVMRVIVNLLTKAATSPFSLLGSMFGGGGDELAFQEFAPGSTELQAAEKPKLDTMVKALTNRPGLSLGIEGDYDTAADTYALKRVKLADQVRRVIWEAKHAKDPNIAPPAELVITPEEDAAMVKKLFDEKFPSGTKFDKPLEQAPLVAAPPPEPKRGFWQRVWDFITFKSSSRKPAAVAQKKPEMEKPAAASTATPSVPLDEMTGRLAETIAVDENDLRALADARAQRVRDYFSHEGKIAADRVFLEQGGAAKESKQDKGPRVFLSLQ